MKHGKKILLCLLAFLLALALTFNEKHSAKAAEPHVFQQFSIQEAINNASIDATINVPAGVYKESIIVNKTVKLLGENRENTIIQANDTNVVRIVANNVYISGFTIRNGNDGISLQGSSNSTITSNIIFNNTIGIRVNNAKNNTINENILLNNTRTGTGCGILLNGISWRNTLEDNLIKFSGEAIYLYSGNNTVTRNRLISNSRTGICVMKGIVPCDYNVIRDNVIINGSCYGIDLWSVNYNIIFNNTLKNNGLGMHSTSSVGNIIYHNNFIDNFKQVYCYDSQNVWDNGFEGNYWSDYKWIDFNIYGIGTRPYNISLRNSINLDTYPLRSCYVKGDANHDGVVGTADVNLIRLAWLTSLQEDGYTPYVDFNQDKIVNIKDGALIGYYWLKSLH